MARVITFQAPSLGFGTFGIASIQMDVAVDSVTTTSRLYYFNIGQFSAFVDTANPNYASLHFGGHVVTINSADYDTFISPNGTVASAAVLGSDVAEAIAQLAA